MYSDYARVINWIISRNISGSLDEVGRIGSKAIAMSPDGLLGYLAGLKKVQSELDYFVTQERIIIEKKQEEIREKRNRLKVANDEFTPTGLEISPDGTGNMMAV